MSARTSPRAFARSMIARTIRRRGSTRCSENSACMSGSPATSDSSRGISVSAPVRAAPARTACAVAAKSPASEPVSSGSGMSELRCTIAARASSSLEP